MPKTKLDRMGHRWDIDFRLKSVRKYLADKVRQARKIIYKLGQAVAGSGVDGVLKATSSVPVLNTFVERLGESIDVSRMMVVDLMHEFELGVWKTLFTHLVRILHAASERPGALADELNARFRQVPTFGRYTIRRFHNNVSEMKKLAARDFEDILQCSIPAFEGLLPEPFNTMLLRLLYKAAEWHALTKLRLHTDSTLDLLEEVTKEFGYLMRQFRNKTSDEFNTVELPRGADARNGRTRSSKKKELNLNTYKFHALADYGELAHRLVKRLYGLTNKQDAPGQVASRYCREKHFSSPSNSHDLTLTLAHEPEHDSSGDSPELHHTITNSRNNPTPLSSFSNTPDPAKRNFIHKLRIHLLSRLLGGGLDSDDPSLFTDEERNSVRIVNNTVFSAKQFSVNYTTYDIRRDRDTISPRSHPYVMVRSPEAGDSSHPYWYAQVLGIYHTIASTSHPAAPKQSAQSVQFLWVRWLGIEPGYHSGSRVARLPKVGFVEATDDDAFGFLDPDLVIRGSHLIPAFYSGRTCNLMPYNGPTVARPIDEKEDWVNFYVNIFVDRDMFVRYLGGGIGHLEQFPPANNDNEITYEYGDEDDGIAMDDGGTRETDENESDENEQSESEGDDKEDEQDGWSDPGESSDEDMGNTY
ncbi:hypothetical protein BJ322DRAFT_1109524 [Thelephora terrestris]|uniref:Uncharacterized protein n=1 Tax=Thelephora terrestris TaxID=56493 RepID=A0A9P6HBN5_9AGAM|nr:hypothetical protein BJ322DRAFT_1109524 [Thelephora terrestris]